MNNTKNIFRNGGRCVVLLLAITMVFSGCGIYGKYQPTETLTDTTHIPSYRDVFAGNEELLTLIDTALAHNLDLQIAHEHVAQAEAALLGSKLAYLPGIYAGGTPVGQAQFAQGSSVYSHTFASANWEIDIFGRLTNLKRMAKATAEQQKDYEQAARTQLIASVAETYFMVLMLDAEIRTADAAIVNWKRSVDTQKQLKEAGMSDEAAVAQFKASYESTRAQAAQLRLMRTRAINALSLLLATEREVNIKGTLEKSIVADPTIRSIDLRVLRSRPDVRAAERQLEYAFYGRNYARANCCPSISISGAMGWANGGLLFSAIGNLLQPIFNSGKNIAEVRIAKSKVKEQQLAFAQKLLEAGTELNDALATVKTVREQAPYYDAQVEALEAARDATTTKMQLGRGTYLEVLLAENNLLEAQMTQIENRMQILLSSVKLYHLLGGGK